MNPARWLPPVRLKRSGDAAMMLARVIGTVVSTVKDPGLEGRKLLLLQPLTRDGQPKGKPLVGIDSIGAGFGEMVYWCRGNEASLAFKDEVPSDCSVVGIVDTIHLRPAPVQNSESPKPRTATPRANSRRSK
jgi:bacterial microcompartment shell vertex protein